MELNRRTAQRVAIQRAHDFANGANLQNAVPELRERLRLLETYWERFDNEHMAVMENLVVPNDLIPQHEFAAEVEQLYLNAKTILERRKTELDQPVNRPDRNEQQPNLGAGADAAAAADIRLERLRVTTFNGEFAKWSEWRAMYEGLVHGNNLLSTTQKFHYLKKSLTGEAERVLGGWQTTGENYEQAYNSLVELYDNQYRIIIAHLDELFKLEQNRTETNDGLRNLIDTTNRVLRQLTVIGCPTAQWDHIMIHLLIARMAPRTKQEWETSNDLREMPALADVIQFLERRARGIVNLAQSTSNGGQTPQGSGNVQNTGTKPKPKATNTQVRTNNNGNAVNCHNCNMPHPMHRCQKFLSLTIDQRRDRVRELQLCFNCFSPNHRAGSQSCKFGACRNCNGNKLHNSLLCVNANQRANVNTVNVSAGTSQTNELPDQQMGNVATALYIPSNHPSNLSQNPSQQNFRESSVARQPQY